MLRNIALSMALLLCFGVFTGCTDKDSAQTDEGETYYLNYFDAWWYTAEYDPELTGVQIFSVNSDYNAAVAYNDVGEDYMEFDAYIKDGKFVLNSELFGEVFFTIIDLDTLEIDDTGVRFYRGEPYDPLGTEQDAASAALSIEGTWLAEGKPKDDTDKIIQIEGTTAIYSAMNAGEFLTMYEGEYTLGESDVSYMVGDSERLRTLKLGDSYSFTVSSDGNTLELFAGFSGDYYLRESMIGTPEGDSALLRQKLQKKTWSCRANKKAPDYLEFIANGVFLHMSAVSNDDVRAWGEEDYAGKWEMDGEEVVLNWDNGAVDRLTPTYDEESDKIKFTVDSLGMDFESSF